MSSTWEKRDLKDIILDGIENENFHGTFIKNITRL